MNINDLPEYVVEEIFSYLTIKERFQCERVCRFWQQHIFTSIKTLAVDVVPNDKCESSILLSQHKHTTGRMNRLPYKVNKGKTLKYVISKCGRNLRVFQGYVKYDTMVFIAEHCKQLHCIDMHFDSLETMMLLSSSLGHQLTCAIIYDNLREGIDFLLHTCSHLTLLALMMRRRQTASKDRRGTVELFDFHDDVSALQMSLKHLVIEDIRVINEETLKKLVLLRGLETASINLRLDLNKSLQWKSVMRSWSGLRYLHLEVIHVLCLHFGTLPPNLEYFSLVFRNFYSETRQCEHKTSMFSVKLPRLKTIKVYVQQLTLEHLSSVVNGIVCCCPNIQHLSLGTDARKVNNLRFGIDNHLAPLLSLASLRRLSLGHEFDITDSFASELVNSIDNLTLFGELTRRVGNPVSDYLFSTGPLFWNALRNKAVTRPTEQFCVIGKCKGILHLAEPLPSNISLHVKSHTAEIRLTNNFGNSKHWLKLVNSWSDVGRYFIELTEKNFQSIGMSYHAKHLIVHYRNTTKEQTYDTLTFSPPLPTHNSLPNLGTVAIYQQIMSNKQVGATLACITKLCPNLNTVSVDRGNAIHEPIDDQVVSLFSCRSLNSLRFSERLIVSDMCSARLVSEIVTLKVFGTCPGQRCSGFQFGPLFLNALVAKALKGTHIIVEGGPNSHKVEEMIKPVRIPGGLNFY